MLIERNNNEVIIRLPSNVDVEDLQKILNFARYKEITAKFKVSTSQVNELISDIKSNWNKKQKQKKATK